MRWLHWAKIDLEHGLGGVEVHSRSLARELLRLGVNHHFSRDPKDLFDPHWDVVHTHGSAVSIRLELRRLFLHSRTGPIRIHALHGTTIGRMHACREWTWPGGYLAALRELLGVLNADLVYADHAELWLFKLAKWIGKKAVVLSNGWDSFEQGEAGETLPQRVQKAIQGMPGYWVYLGRGGDPVKAVERLGQISAAHAEFHLVATPGEGFESHAHVLKTGRLSQAQVGELLRHSRGLVLSSRYEGLPLAVLEALGEGIPVVCTAVGGLRTLPAALIGLTRVEPAGSMEKALWEAILESQRKFPNSEAQRLERRGFNRGHLRSWAQIAQIAVDGVATFRDQRARALSAEER